MARTDLVTEDPKVPTPAEIRETLALIDGDRVHHFHMPTMKLEARALVCLTHAVLLLLDELRTHRPSPRLPEW